MVLLGKKGICFHDKNPFRTEIDDIFPSTTDSHAFKTRSVRFERKIPINRRFIGTIKETRQKEDLDFSFPVTILEGETPQWEPLPLKTLNYSILLRALGKAVHTHYRLWKSLVACG